MGNAENRINRRDFLKKIIGITRDGNTSPFAGIGAGSLLAGSWINWQAREAAKKETAASIARRRKLYETECLQIFAGPDQQTCIEDGDRILSESSADDEQLRWQKHNGQAAQLIAIFGAPGFLIGLLGKGIQEYAKRVEENRRGAIRNR